MWKEADTASYVVLSQDLRVGTEKMTNNLSQGSQSLDWDLNPGLPNYKGGARATCLEQLLCQ
jgi:hypothetical protein